MAKYTSKKVASGMDATDVVAKFDDLSRFQPAIDRLPDEVKSKLGELRFEPDALVINTPQLGAIKLQVVERSANRVVFEAAASMVPLRTVVDVVPDKQDATSILTASFDVDIPVMLRPLIGGKLQEAADKMAEMLGNIVTKA